MIEYISNQYDTLKTRIEVPRKFIQAIVGLRQVGKSTLVILPILYNMLFSHFQSVQFLCFQPLTLKHFQSKIYSK